MAQERKAITVFVVGLFFLLGLWLVLDDKCDDCGDLTITAGEVLAPTTSLFEAAATSSPLGNELLPVDDPALTVPAGGRTAADSDNDLGQPDNETDSDDFIDDLGDSRNNGIVDQLVDPRSATTSTTQAPSDNDAEPASVEDSSVDGFDESTGDGDVAPADSADPQVVEDGASTTFGEDAQGATAGTAGDGDTQSNAQDDAPGTLTPDTGTPDRPIGSADTGGGAVNDRLTVLDTYPENVEGPTIYVDPVDGDDESEGSSEDAAFVSLQRALDVVRPGQTIRLMTGQYRETRAPGELHYYLGRGGRPDAWVTITAADGHRPELVANSGTALFLNASYVEVSNLTIRGESFNQTNSWGVGISVPNVHHVRLVGNRISGMPAGGISVVGSSNFQILNNTVFENALWSDVAGSGISVFEARDHGFGPDVGKYHDLIVGNRVFRNENRVPSKWQDHRIITDGNGIIIDSSRSSGYSGWTLVANNLAVNNGSRGILVWDSSRVDVVFNTMYHNAATTNMGHRVELASGRSTEVRLAHNIAWARPGIRAAVFTDEPTVVSQGNVYVTTNAASKAGPSDLIHSGDAPANLMIAPSTNFGSSDFRPVPGGPLIGLAGGGHSGPTAVDGAGTVRGPSSEPGAFEFDAGRGR